MTELKVGILGLGHLHPRTYMPHFAATPATRVVAACDASESLRESFGRDFGARVYPTWRKLLASESLDLAYLFLPHKDCPAAAVACAKLGIHVVVEKPVAASAAGCRRVVDACRDNGVLFSTPYLWRYHPVCRQMKAIIRSGALGRIVGCEGRCAAGGLHRYLEGHAAWMLDRKQSGGGPMFNLGVHWIDLFRWLLDGEIIEVIGKNVQINQDYNIEDNSMAICTFDNGTLLALDISYTVPDGYPHGRDLYLALRGTEGCLSYSPAFEGTEQSLFVCRSNPRSGGAACETMRFTLDDVPGYCGPLGREYVAEIAENIFQKSEPRITGKDAIRALEVAEAVYRSSKSGKAARLTS